MKKKQREKEEGRGLFGQLEVLAILRPHCKHDSSEKECVGEIKNGDHKQVNTEADFFFLLEWVHF